MCDSKMKHMYEAASNYLQNLLGLENHVHPFLQAHLATQEHRHRPSFHLCLDFLLIPGNLCSPALPYRQTDQAGLEGLVLLLDLMVRKVHGLRLFQICPVFLPDL